jgi:hypothetical protein
MQEAIRRAFSKAAKVRLEGKRPFLDSDNQVRIFLSRKIEGRALAVACRKRVTA